MQHANFRFRFLRTVVLAVLGLIVFSFSSKAGLDSYSIYLNNKLVVKQNVNEPFKVDGLLLEKAKPGDKLVIYYSQCNAPNKIGKGRSIIVKNEKGITLKQWSFDDVEGQDKGMVISVGELLELKKAGNERLILMYDATQLAKAQALSGVKFG